MNFLRPVKPELHPLLQLLLLLGYAMAGAVVFTLLSFIFVLPIYGMGVIDGLMTGNITGKTADALKIMQAASSIGVFIVPALLLVRTEGRKFSDFYHFRRPEPSFFLLVLAIMVASLPVMECVALWNQKMVLPEGLKWLEDWMRRKEDEAMEITIALISTKSIGGLLVNMLVIAILPGIGEELMFRGAVQRAFGRAFRNPHFVIWITAFIFSAIHMQFYGFLPRLLLGAAFGYIYFWTGNLWYAMFAHFLNNAYSVTAAYIMQQQGHSLREIDSTAYFAWYGYVISLILTIALFRILRNRGTKRETELDQSLHNDEHLRGRDFETGSD
ncbi:CPBP family intramembrane metalloprotease domain-containing protein [Pedobacter yulinensis]|uniref:CPBP family intramembrane metalloprotease domain-containing protein n=1 Tax=Pedobacter yulinensis TaxID=2126353 RepID=A0A2T3HRG9_9SPHI|nr:CPBP family intramembrane glutamic endopeptidase [Pedobacter yulinensis]PST85054.1 CPBP family intramembrane metalloprotease domain-containing protein [Pedobacter yulinensis]